MDDVPSLQRPPAFERRPCLRCNDHPPLQRRSAGHRKDATTRDATARVPGLEDEGEDVGLQRGHLLGGDRLLRRGGSPRCVLYPMSSVLLPHFSLPQVADCLLRLWPVATAGRMYAQQGHGRPWIATHSGARRMPLGACARATYTPAQKSPAETVRLLSALMNIFKYFSRNSSETDIIFHWK